MYVFLDTIAIFRKQCAQSPLNLFCLAQIPATRPPAPLQGLVCSTKFQNPEGGKGGGAAHDIKGAQKRMFENSGKHNGFLML